MEMYSIGKFAKMIGVTPVTLRHMQQTGELIPYRISKSGTRYYSSEQLMHFLNNNNKPLLVVGYCRVSTPSQKDDLETQISNVRTYMIAKGYQFEIIQDIGSGINYNKKGLRVLFDNTIQSKEQELTDDLIQIITVFANRLYGSRSKKIKRLIDEVKKND